MADPKDDEQPRDDADRADRFSSTAEVWVDGKPVGPTFPIPMAQRVRQMLGVTAAPKKPKAD